MRNLIALIMLCSLGLASPAVAQSRYLPEGRSGFGLGGLFQFSDSETAVGIDAGMSVKGQFDFALAVARIDLDSEVLGPGGGGFAFQPSVTYTALRPTRTGGLGLELGGQYEYGSYTNDVLDDLGVRIEGTAYGFGGRAYWRFVSNPELSIYPSVGATWVHAELKRAGHDIADPQEDIGWEFGLAFFTGHTLAIEPTVVLIGGETIQSIRVTYIIPGT